MPGPRWRRGFTLAAACVAVSLASASALHAEDVAGEAVIGTFESTTAKRAAEGRPATFDFEPGAREGAASASTAGDDEVSRIFADGLDSLEDGNATAAQRKFETVVAREPDGHLAKSARAYLADLYRAMTDKASAQPEFATQRSALGAADIAARDDKRERARQAGAPVPPGMEEEFIIQAGDRVFFGSGSAELGQRARIVLAAQARWLARHGDVVAVIEGHADDGALPDAQSAELSERRALAVRDRLVAEGVAPIRLIINSAGRSQPIAKCPGSDCAAQNRRVVTVLKSGTRQSNRRGATLASDGKADPTH